MADDSRIRHIEVRTMASDQRSVQERGGAEPRPYVPEASVEKGSEKDNVNKNRKAPEPPKTAPEPPDL